MLQEELNITRNITQNLITRRDFLKKKLNMLSLTPKESSDLKNEIKGIEYSIAITTMELGYALIDDAQDILNKLDNVEE